MAVLISLFRSAPLPGSTLIRLAEYENWTSFMAVLERVDVNLIAACLAGWAQELSIVGNASSPQSPPAMIGNPFVQLSSVYRPKIFCLLVMLASIRMLYSRKSIGEFADVAQLSQVPLVGDHARLGSGNILMSVLPAAL